MAFEDYEVSIESGQPVKLYVLTLGTTIWRMHNSIETTITWSGDVYRKTNISEETIDSGADDLVVTIPGDHTFALNHVEVAPGQVATLTIYNYQRGDTTDVKIIHKGVVRAVAFAVQGHAAKLHLMPITELFNKPIPDSTYQASCNHVLFDNRCTVDQTSFKFSGTVSAVSGNTVIVPGLTTAKGAEWARGGYISYGGILDYRLILGQPTDTITMIVPFFEPVLGQSVDVYSGCDHALTTCTSKFSNDINFGGWPYVPTKNIFVTGI